MTRLLRRLRAVSPCRCRAAGARWRGAPFKGRAAPRSGDFKEFPALLCDRGRLRQNGRCTLQQPHAASSSASQVRSAALSTLQSHRRPTKTRRQNASWTQSTQKCPKSEAPMKNKKKIASLFFFFFNCHPSVFLHRTLGVAERCSCTPWASTAWQLQETMKSTEKWQQQVTAKVCLVKNIPSLTAAPLHRRIREHETV